MNKQIIKRQQPDNKEKIKSLIDGDYTNLDSVAREVYPSVEIYNQNKKNKQPVENRLDKVRKSNDNFKRFMQRIKNNINNNTNESKNTMSKQVIRLTESDLHKIVKEAVNKILTESSIDDVFDGMPHTYTVDLYTRSEGKFGYAFSNIRNYDELNAAIKEKFPDVLNWKNPRRNKPFNGWH